MSTIVAISTSPGIGGIGIIRMSGEKCFEIINKIFIMKNHKELDKIAGYTMHYGNIINPENSELIDEVLVSFFKAPKSFTTENMCEINSHGGTVVMKQILDLCLRYGAELAEPGEFTKRAFLNGRIDLIEAEATIDIINAKTDKEKRAVMGQLKGYLSEEINNIKKDILSIMADIEANIDYPEYDIEEVSNENIRNVLEISKVKLQKLCDSFQNGKILKEGIRTAIIGKPNVGKSSLLNIILKEERAIVTEFEGTTRDTIEEFISVDGIPLNIIDTAGIRQTNDEVEKIGISKSIDIAKNSDLIIAIFDVSRDFTKEDFEIIDIIKNKNSIVVLNKNDLINKDDIDESIFPANIPIVRISVAKKAGIEDIYSVIKELYNTDSINIEGENIITNARHENLIRKTIGRIEEAEIEFSNGLALDIIAIYVKDILDLLGKVTGENVSESIINEIFSKFCLGK